MMSMCVIMAVTLLSTCITVCLISQKRSLQRALGDVREEIDRVRAALEEQGKGSYHDNHKWASSNHTVIVERPTKGPVGSCSQPAKATGKIARQDQLYPAHSCPSLTQQQMHPSSADDYSCYSSGGLEELMPVSSPSVTAADDNLTVWPQQRWREGGEVGQAVVWV